MRILLFVLLLSIFQAKITSNVFAQSPLWKEAEKERKRAEKERKKAIKNQDKTPKKGVGVQKWDNKFDKKPARRKRGSDIQTGKNNPDSSNKKPKTKKNSKKSKGSKGLKKFKK